MELNRQIRTQSRDRKQKSGAKFLRRTLREEEWGKGTGSAIEGKRMGTREHTRIRRREKTRVSVRDEKNCEVGEKGLFKGPSGSNVAFIGLLSAKHWSRAPR